MTLRPLPDEALTRRFREAVPGEGGTAACWIAERILKAALGEIAAEERRALADHAAVCGDCATVWRVAIEFTRQAGLQVQAPRSTSGVRWLISVAAAAALILVAVVVERVREGDRLPPVMRTAPENEVTALIEDGAALDRSSFTLRWSSGPDGSRYTVRVTGEDLSHLAGAAELTSPEFTIPEEALKALPPDALLFWQVETVLPGGRRALSRTFVARVP